jgi:flagellar motor switch protein FliG
MTASNQTKPASPSRALTGAEKVAVLLLALERSRATQLLKRFDPSELRLITRSASHLRPVNAADLEALVEEFAKQFSSGVNFVGTLEEVERLLAGVMTEDQIAEVMSDERKKDEPVWETVSGVKQDVVRAYLSKEHPQTVALILSRIDSSSAAKIIGSFPGDVRNGLLCRMLAIKSVADDVMRVVERVVYEDITAQASSSGGDSHLGVADILNKLDKTQTDDVLKALLDQRPEDAKALKSMLFSFEDLVKLDPRARTTLFDQVPIERLVLALRGTEAEFQNIILSSLASRSKRMVEAELQGGSAASAREVADARRSIVEAVLKMVAKGDIVLGGSEGAEASADASGS